MTTTITTNRNKNDDDDKESIAVKGNFFSEGDCYRSPKRMLDLVFSSLFLKQNLDACSYLFIGVNNDKRKIYTGRRDPNST
mmetsp:Transcript_37688/g.41637  ORF Transcript_37688/g.41637 Transcript_37688/m.41637 type:complete len:81 (-) Transcript_37688:364-606(-)